MLDEMQEAKAHGKSLATGSISSAHKVSKRKTAGPRSQLAGRTRISRAGV